MINFEYHYWKNCAVIYLSNSEENGWEISYNKEAKQFVVVENVEHEALSINYKPNRFDNLEDVLEFIKNLT